MGEAGRAVCEAGRAAGEALPFYEFFAGGGMARLALGPRWRCVFANEFCEKKARAYRMNFGPSPELKVADVWTLAADCLPGQATLAWASFPCQDLSLAGNGAGLRGERSGAFAPFWNLMEELAREGRAVPLIVAENVVGALTSNGGRDFAAILDRMVRSGYRAGALVIDAARFIPQSRPRLFIVAVSDSVELPDAVTANGPVDLWHNRTLRSAQGALPASARRRWIWWNLPEPPPVEQRLADLIDPEAEGVAWHSAGETERLVGLMSEANRRKLEQAQAARRRVVGTVYKRMRRENGIKTQRAEVRFDQVSGCLRTPAGGSSRQSILVVEGESVRSRLLSAREAARLMGLPESYRLPDRYNEAYHVAGDGLVVPVVQWLERCLLRPVAERVGKRGG